MFGRYARLLVFGLFPVALDAQERATIQQIRQADSTSTTPRIGDTVVVAGRVILGTGALDTMRLRLYVEDHTGGIHVFGTSEQRRLEVRLGDSVEVRGIITRYRNRIELGRAVVQHMEGPRLASAPRQIDTLSAHNLDAALFRRVTFEGTVAAVRLGRGRRLLELAHPADSSQRSVDVVELPNSRHAMRLERFSPGDRARTTGVLGQWMNPTTGEIRYSLYAESWSQLRPVGMTRHERQLWLAIAGGLLAVTVLGIWYLSARRSAARQERQRADAAAALRASEERFRLAARATKDVVWEWDIAADGFWWSDAAQHVLGQTVHELDRVIPALSARVHPEERDRVRAGVERALRNPAQDVWSDEYRYRLPDDGYATLFDRACIVRDPEGQATRIIGAVQDLSERHHLEDQLRQAQKMEAIGQLAAGIAHDFNNLLTVVSGMSDLMLEDLPADSPSRADVEQIKLAGSRAAALTRQLLTFSRREVVQRQSVDVSDVLAECGELLRRTLGQQIVLDIAAGNGPCTTMADRGELTQVLMNLAVNARDAMHGKGVLTIRLARVSEEEIPSSARTPRPGAHVMLTVRDTGDGIDPAVLDRIFDPFFTTKPAGAGTGLGLSTVYGIVTRAGGTIFVESTRGAGATFTVLLPFESAPPAGAPAAPGPVKRGSGLILLVEDEPAVRAAAARALAARGYGVIEAANGREGLARWRELGAAIRAVASDVVMPEMDGTELVRAIRAESPEVPVLFMSGYANATLGPEDLAHPCTAFLPKPFALDLLCASLAELMDRCEMEAEPSVRG